MKKLILACVLLALLATSAGAEEAATPAPAPTGNPAETTTASATPPKITSPDMNLQTEGALPAQFRGGDPDSSLVHVLEDQKYIRQEHTLLYEDDATALGKEAKDTKSTFAGPPTINWTNERVNPDGSVSILANANTNLATNESEFPEPGEYRVGNSGARKVSSGKVDTADTGTTGTTGETGTTGTTGTAGTEGTGPTGEDAKTQQRITSTQTMGVLCHDCTAPNLWAVFQEGAGNTNLAESERHLKDELQKQMELTKGEFSLEAPLTGDLQEASLVAMFESPRNVKPTMKTAGVAVRGVLFDQTGKKVADLGGVAPMKLLDNETQTRKAAFSVTETTAPADAKLRGIFVRRNVPFLAAVHMTDNGAYNSDAATCKIVKAGTDEVVEKTDGAYFFRVPNYPREEYTDQPGYEFVMEGADEAGNQSVMRLPVYVVNTQSSIEGGKNE
jgi:hypothetical protein